MPNPSTYDYGIIRVVPSVERGEALNAGVILFCRTQRYLAARIELNEVALQAMAPRCDAATVQQHLDLFPQICAGAGPIGALPIEERFHWLVAPRSTIIQVSEIHSGLSTSPNEALDRLVATLVLR